MHELARLVRDNFALLLLVLLVLVMLFAWLIFELFRGAESRSEVKELRRRLSELEAARAYTYSAARDPAATPRQTVLPARWVRKGAAATTSDGGCLVIVAEIAPARKSAVLTIRLDGLPGVREEIRGGQRLEVTGKLGTYTLELERVGQSEALLGISLRNRHGAGGDSAL